MKVTNGKSTLGMGGMTKGVKTLMGDPKKAIIKLSIPMIIAMSVQTIYQLVDAIWVAGLGPDALSAVGFFLPFFFGIMAISAGLGIGGGSAISRRIGANDKEGADQVASHTLVLMLIVCLIFTIPMFIFAEPILRWIGAGKTTEIAASYAQVMFGGAIFIFFANVANAIFRSEGDAKRAMIALTIGAVLNIILDPIYIYTLNFGVAGAAWATIISYTISALIMAYWLFIKKITFVSFRFKGFRFRKHIVKDILKVGVPASATQLSMAVSQLLLNIILVNIGGTDGIAILTTGWRVVMFATLPLIGIATGVTTVCGATYGMKDYRKLKTALMYAIKIGMVIEIIIGILTVVFAPQITRIFIRTESAQRIEQELILFLRIMAIYYPIVSLGMFSSSMFQGVGKGDNSLVVTLIRTLILTPSFALIFGLYFTMDMTGIWFGIVLANVLGGTLAFIWARSFIAGLLKKTAQFKSKDSNIL